VEKVAAALVALVVLVAKDAGIKRILKKNIMIIAV
jgi:hypothetical protein